METHTVAAEITRASKSNLALAFVSLSGQRRRDITTFYAFCRVIDDIADDPRVSAEVKRTELARWRRSLREAFPDQPPLAGAVRAMMATYPLRAEMLEEIIAGVEMDVEGCRYQTWEELRVYCYRVASAVGLVSIEIFGYTDPRCREYAVELGLALQVTNIIRDVGVDLTNGRIYLPTEDLNQFGYPERDLRARVHDDRFARLMRFQATRARAFFAQAAKTLPAQDRRAMVPAEIMRSVYQALLTRMERDGFRVFDHTYRLSRMEKTARVVGQLLKFK